MRYLKANGFTLIELLVVIAIIAILAAILFPVFAQAREKARQITCVSNEKNIGLAVMMYTQDFDEHFPPDQYFDSGFVGAYGTTHQHVWNQSIFPYIKNGKPDNNVGGVTGGVFSCPDIPVTQAFNYHPREDWFLDSNTPGYVGQMQFEGNIRSETPSLSEVDTPGNTIMIVEGGEVNPTDGSYLPITFVTQEWYWGSNVAQIGDPSNGMQGDLSGAMDADSPSPRCTNAAGQWPVCAQFPRFRHGGNVTNAIFSDGHVKSIRKVVNWYLNIYNPQTNNSVY